MYHGISKEQANELGHVMDLLYPDEKKNQEYTFVILDDLTKDENGKEKKQVRVQDYGDPARQVKKTAVTLSKELAKHNYKLYIQPILYFAYKEDEINNVMNHSIQESPEVISNEHALGNYIEELIEKPAKLSKEDINKVRGILYKMNNPTNTYT